MHNISEKHCTGSYNIFFEEISLPNVSLYFYKKNIGRCLHPFWSTAKQGRTPKQPRGKKLKYSQFSHNFFLNNARSKKLAKFCWINIFFSPTMINCGLACADVDNSSSVSSILQKHQNTTTPDHLLSQEFHLSRIFWAIFQSFSQKHQHIISQGFPILGQTDFPTLSD